MSAWRFIERKPAGAFWLALVCAWVCMAVAEMLPTTSPSNGLRTVVATGAHSTESDWSVDIHELLTGSTDVDMSGNRMQMASSPDTRAKGLGIDSAMVTMTSGDLIHLTLPAMSVESRLFHDGELERTISKNKYVEQDYETPSELPESVTWRPVVRGVIAQSQSYRNGCSEIPLFEKGSILLNIQIRATYTFSTLGEKLNTPRTLLIVITDPNELYVSGRCWKNANHGLSAQVVPSPSLDSDLKKRAELAALKLTTWLSSAGNHLDERVAVELRESDYQPMTRSDARIPQVAAAVDLGDGYSATWMAE